MSDKLESVANIRKKHSPLQNTNAVHKKSFSSLERLAIFITQHVGTMGFFFIIFTWTVSWLSWNMFAPQQLRFDPYPAFVLWLFISNMIQISLMPLIMVGQNIQGRHSEIRADLDYETNKRSSKEIEIILLHLESQQKLLLKMMQKLQDLETKRT